MVAWTWVIIVEMEMVRVWASGLGLKVEPAGLLNGIDVGCEKRMIINNS